MAANYVLLEKITVGAAGASSVTFSGIPQTGYTDLVMKCSARTNRASFDEVIAVSFNGSTSSFSWRLLNANGTSPGSYNGTTNIMAGRAVSATATASTFSNSEVYIPNYASSNYKSFSVDSVAENNSTTLNDLDLHAGLWSNTAAITSIALTPNSGGVFNQYTTFYLYGVAKLGTTPAIVPYATGGDTIMTDGTYWYHTFTSSGTFTPQKAISCDYLVVAGGGGAGSTHGGGGGAGGYRTSIGGSALSLGTSAYTVTIGAGGAGGPSGGGFNGTQGSNSVFSTITSTGGGRGGFGYTGSTAGGAGGSAGGSGAGTTTSVSPSPSGEGNAGGGGASDNTGGGGGGGGANAAGGTGSKPSAALGGNGGAGIASSISGTSVTRAGGGGGGSDQGTAGTGGAGGGGNGNFSGNGSAGTANTGGGGGGGGANFGAGGAGGSGIVIVRYAV